MTNPFPGMNPWLELDWPEVHTRMIVYSGDQLQEQMPAGLRVRVEQDVVIDGEDQRGRLRLDTHVVHSWDGPTDSSTLLEASSASVGMLVIEDPPPQRHLEIFDAQGVLVTAIEFLSPTNKTTGDGWDAYKSKQRTYLEARVNLVEIDLIRRGIFSLAMQESSFPVQPPPPYKACVFRGQKPRQREAFPIPLRDRLPRLPIPLRPSDREATLDLQPIIDRCCIYGAYGAADYQRALVPPMLAEDQSWLASRLQAVGVNPA